MATKKKQTQAPPAAKSSRSLVSIPRDKVLGLACNLMDDEQGDKNMVLSVLAEYLKPMTEADVEKFVMMATKLPGYNFRDGLRIYDLLARFRVRFCA